MPINIKQATKDIAVTNNDGWIVKLHPKLTHLA
jgi:hypothetical protein